MFYTTAFAAVAALGSIRGALVGGSPSFATAASRRVTLDGFKRYGEGLGGALIALAGVALWLWPTP